MTTLVDPARIDEATPRRRPSALARAARWARGEWMLLAGTAGVPLAMWAALEWLA